MTVKGRVVGGAWVVDGSKLDPVIADKGDPGNDGNHGLDGADGILSVQRKSLTTDTNGVVTWTFDAAFSTPPLIAATIIDTSGGTDAYTVKVTAISATAASFKVNRSQLSTVSLLGLTILSIPSTIGAITFHAVAVPSM